LKLENVQAKNLAEKDKNEFFGFKCLHYSVSESTDKLQVVVYNKNRQPNRVRVTTIDGDAKANEDYTPVDAIVEFARGEYQKTVDIAILDDDQWEPDEDFFVQLYDAESNNELFGQDTKCTITIIDDDKPGQIFFPDAKGVKVSVKETEVEIKVGRKNGCDGQVTVDYATKQLGNVGVAVDGVHYTGTNGTLVFENQETEKSVFIQLIPQPDDEEFVDNAFQFVLSNVKPTGKGGQGAQLSKKNYVQVNIVTNLAEKKQADIYAQLLQRLKDEEEKTWASQFVTACMLHPTKGENGEIQDISFLDGFLHFATIGWKLFFAFIPPAHYGGGIPCFFIALAFIGFVTFIVGEFASLFGCVLGIKPGITAITFVALGTSLPDTFASMAAAKAEKYADSAIGNVTGSNSVNVFLGLGLPWVIASWYETRNNDDYYVPAGSLGFSVVVFVICALLCIITLLVRRCACGGELGGSAAGRAASL